MEKDLLLLQDQAGGMDTAAADRWDALKKRGALQGHAQVIHDSRHSMSRTCGPRDMISLVIPRIGDNVKGHLHLIFISIKGLMHEVETIY
jgi:hypothetical protein